MREKVGILRRESDSHSSKKVQEEEKLDDSKDFVNVFLDHRGRFSGFEICWTTEDNKRYVEQYESLGMWNDIDLLDGCRRG